MVTAVVLIVIGVVFVWWGRTRSEFVVYRLFTARARLVWGDRVHGMFQVSGALMMVLGGVLLGVG